MNLGLTPSRRAPGLHLHHLLLAAACPLLLLSACDDGDDGDQGPPGPPGTSPTETALEQGDPLPGIVLEILAVSGATGPGGNFSVGDRITVRYSLEKDDGTPWDLDELSSGRVLVSGPTFNYQRVIAEQTDLLSKSTTLADGTHRYTFGPAIPATYLAPFNDTPSFGPDEGELSGQALLAGTYTVGMYATWNYTVDGQGKRDAGESTQDFLLGSGAGALASREVVSEANCNQCHEDLQAHGGQRRDVVLCLMCHTAGSEDRNVPSAAGGTPGASIEFKVMIHKIHAGSHLPSVLGVSTNPDGSRDYGATPMPYQLVGFNNSIHDYSNVAHPIWPVGLSPMPRDMGYTALSATDKATEDRIRSGPTDCAVCHGDPDGAGPLEPPSQGMIAFSQPSRRSCGACHDDVIWGNPYTANGSTMPDQANDSNCLLCHEASGSALASFDAHVHPLKDAAFNPGVNVLVQSVSEAGTNNGDGNIDVGEKIAVTWVLEDDAGMPIAPGDMSSMSAVVSGPTDNYNLLLNAPFPPAILSGAQPYTTMLPEVVQLEYVGDSTGGLDSFTTARFPHWDVSGAATSVWAVTAAGASSTLAADAEAPQNYVDLVSAAGFARNDYVVLDPGAMTREYLRVQLVDGNRLWFGSTASTGYPPGLRLDRAAGTTVQVVTLTAKTAGVDYTLDAPNGAIDELMDFGAGNAVVVTYTTDFVLPATYPQALNGSPDLDDAVGEWTGKPLVDGTYSLSIWGYRTLTLTAFGESNSYRATAAAEKFDFLVGAATTVEPYELISSGDNCLSCHQELYFHGMGRRGWDSCLLCHGTSGSEDRPQYVAANAPETPGTSINLRTMLHKIHMGEELANASSYVLVGFGGAPWPNNFTPHTYEHVVFPVQPSGVQSCATCHGAGNEAWHEPADRTHPSAQVKPLMQWTAVCGSCHDSDAVMAHISVQTGPTGVESCTVCHSPGSEWNVERMHKVY